MNIAGKSILVVGGSGALGQELCRQLLALGAVVHASARSLDSADSIPAGVTTRLLLDLNSQDGIDAVADYLLGQGIVLDGVIVASGLVGFGTAFDTAAADAQLLMQVNYLGPARLIWRLLPALSSRAAETGEALIAGISGLVAEKAFLGMSAYSASKAAFSSYLAGLGLELRRHKILVLDARPGHTETGLAGRAVFGAAPNFPSGMTARHVVAAILAAITDGKRELASSDF